MNTYPSISPLHYGCRGVGHACTGDLGNLDLKPSSISCRLCDQGKIFSFSKPQCPPFGGA